MNNQSNFVNKSVFSNQSKHPLEQLRKSQPEKPDIGQGDNFIEDDGVKSERRSIKSNSSDEPPKRDGKKNKGVDEMESPDLQHHNDSLLEKQRKAQK